MVKEKKTKGVGGTRGKKVSNRFQKKVSKGERFFFLKRGEALKMGFK